MVEDAGGNATTQLSACCSVAVGPTAQSGLGRTLLGLVCPRGALRARRARPDLTRTGVLCSHIRSTTVFGGGSSSLPRGRGSAYPGIYSSSLSCSRHSSFCGETTVVALSPWWLMLVMASQVVSRPCPCGLLCYGAFEEVDRVFREKSLSARPTPM